jgi:peptidoglycan/LPS O-acetylase OafA/YrhL
MADRQPAPGAGGLFAVRLADVAQRGNNNLDLVRLVLATLVIYGHSFSVNPSPGMGGDLIFRLTGFYAGDLAIKGFFLISGFLVTDSILAHRSIGRYVLARFFRIWPPLAVVVLLTALVMGPLVTSLSPGAYFSDGGLWTYIRKTLTLQNWAGQSLGYFDLPGVFKTNVYPANVNAPLWSLTAEVFAYLLVGLAFLSGGLQRPAALVIFAVIAVDSLLPEKVLFYWLPQLSTDFSALPFCFGFGAMLAVFKDRVVLSPWAILGLLWFAHIFDGSAMHQLLTYAALLIAMFLAAGSRALRALRLPHDISYGVFLYGWPIQQVLAHVFPGWPHLLALIVAVLLAYGFGLASCILVEQPAQDLGRRLTRRVLRPGPSPA